MSRETLREARDELARGEIRDAYERLSGPAYADDFACPLLSADWPRIAGEASSLIRGGLINEAIDRIDGFLAPQFRGRTSYSNINSGARS